MRSGGGCFTKKNEPFPATRSWRRRERSCRRVLRRTGVLLRGTGRPTQLPGRVHKAKGDLHALTSRFQYYLPGGCCFGGIGLNGDVVEMRACPLNPTASLGLVFCQVQAFGCTSGWAMAGGVTASNASGGPVRCAHEENSRLNSRLCSAPSTAAGLLLSFSVRPCVFYFRAGRSGSLTGPQAGFERPGVSSLRWLQPRSSLPSAGNLVHKRVS